MSTQTITKVNREPTLRNVLEEVRDIKIQLKQFLALIPRESLKEYKNASNIKRAYTKAVKILPPN